MAKILIVDNSNLMRAVISNFIKKMNKSIDIFEASDGSEAIEIFKKERPQLTFLDIKMEPMDGLEALKQIKSMDQNAKVVMCTGLKSEDQERQATDAGADGYITKPFSSEDIEKAIENNIR